MSPSVANVAFPASLGASLGLLVLIWAGGDVMRALVGIGLALVLATAAIYVFFPVRAPLSPRQIEHQEAVREAPLLRVDAFERRAIELHDRQLRQQILAVVERARRDYAEKCAAMPGG